MRFRGGYNLRVKGRPSAAVEVLPEPDTLYLPLWSRRFKFTEICVKEGERVKAGRVLARDPANFNVPLLGPRGGIVRLNAADRHIVLENVVVAPEEPLSEADGLPHAPDKVVRSGKARHKLLALGAWQFFSDAHTGALPDPSGQPKAVIVSTLRFEPFLARGDVQITKRLVNFTRGLEHIQSLLEYQPIYLVLPQLKSDLADRVREITRGYAWVNIIHVPPRYPFDNPALLARHLKLKHDPKEPVWAVNVDGVLAVDRALTLSRPCTVRLISLGGPAVADPKHMKTIPGYPLRKLLDGRLTDPAVRVLNGGGLTDSPFEQEQLGIGAECVGITVLPELREREFLGFMRPGADRRSYSACFLSALLPLAPLRIDTAMRGERRACVSCGFCEEVCPAGIMPHLIHKYLYRDGLEEAEAARVELCIGCGLCSFVCPSKIELRRQMLDAQAKIRELQAEEVHS